MAIDIKAPAFPESVADGEVASWHKQAGDSVRRDDLLVEIETDKVVLEVPAPDSGVITEILVQEGETIVSEQVLATMEPGDVAAESKEDAPAAAAPEPAPVAEVSTDQLGPAARQLVEEHKLDVSAITGTGKNGRTVTNARHETLTTLLINRLHSERLN